jgi:hypothetical protein
VESWQALGTVDPIDYGNVHIELRVLAHHEHRLAGPRQAAVHDVHAQPWMPYQQVLEQDRVAEATRKPGRPSASDAITRPGAARPQDSSTSSGPSTMPMML